MNKMLEVLKQLQDNGAAARDGTTKSSNVVRRVGMEETAGRPRKFDVSSWNLRNLDQSSPVTAAEAVAATRPSRPVHLERAVPPVVPIPIVQRFESPWERTARSDLANPLQANTYRAVLDRWRDDLPGNHPRAVMVVGIGCEESDVAEFALRLGMLQANDTTTTLLVDAEPTRWLSNVLVAYDQPGLAEAFVEGVAAKHFFQATHTDGLKLLPGGLLNTKPQHNSVAMARLLNDLKAHAAWTIISAGRGDSIWTADLARASDAVYLLVRLGVATCVEAAQVRQQLQGSGARLLGCIALEGDED